MLSIGYVAKKETLAQSRECLSIYVDNYPISFKEFIVGEKGTVKEVTTPILGRGENILFSSVFPLPPHMHRTVKKK